MSKLHTFVDGRLRPLVLEMIARQANDSPILRALLQGLRVPRAGVGRPRTTPNALLADKAYFARAHRQLLVARGITTVIPQASDHIRHRQARGSAGGHPPSFDADRYRNVVERSYALMKQWRGLATRYDCEDEVVPPRVVV